MKKNKIYILGSRRRTNLIPIVFTVIVAFLVAFPFVAMNLRFQTGYLFSKAFDFVGALCLMGGSFLTAVSILNVFLGGRSLNLKTLTAGIVFLWIGCWLTGGVLNIMGITIGNDHTSPGYH
jgi:hypothetical protein